MLRQMKPVDGVTLTLNGETHEFENATVRVEETSTRGGDKYRYATVTIPLKAGEFPEDVSHMREG